MAPCGMRKGNTPAPDEPRERTAGGSSGTRVSEPTYDTLTPVGGLNEDEPVAQLEAELQRLRQANRIRRLRDEIAVEQRVALEGSAEQTPFPPRPTRTPKS